MTHPDDVADSPMEDPPIEDRVSAGVDDAPVIGHTAGLVNGSQDKTSSSMDEEECDGVAIAIDDEEMIPKGVDSDVIELPSVQEGGTLLADYVKYLD